ncbi:unnamed protein product [Clonostachys rhizophaga]|uniref:Uncharacterized protein n=1 Tax=Clonostachys rhizophaga TaxID=160324 RepID=A0A9N9W7C3_9HYPO|nr:unnamed protein product [Clonostachys rhizophaga]
MAITYLGLVQLVTNQASFTHGDGRRGEKELSITARYTSPAQEIRSIAQDQPELRRPIVDDAVASVTLEHPVGFYLVDRREFKAL